jgi:hypothetical protein
MVLESQINKIIDTHELTEKQRLYHIINVLNGNSLQIINNIPVKLSQMESRLNIKLNNINKRIIQKAIDYKKIDLKKYAPEIEQVYKTHFENVVRLGMDEVSRLPDIRLSLTGTTPHQSRIDNIIEDRTFRASDYTMERLKGDVLPKIQEGIKEGQSYGQTAEQLKSEFVDMSNNQLMRISRTESHSVYNQSKYEAMKASNVIIGNKWVTSGLPNMRPWHEDMEGVASRLDEPFIVDGEELLYPGDPNGSPENIINCACTHTPVTNEDDLTDNND